VFLKTPARFAADALFFHGDRHPVSSRNPEMIREVGNERVAVGTPAIGPASKDAGSLKPEGVLSKAVALKLVVSCRSLVSLLSLGRPPVRAGCAELNSLSRAPAAPCCARERETPEGTNLPAQGNQSGIIGSRHAWVPEK